MDSSCSKGISIPSIPLRVILEIAIHANVPLGFFREVPSVWVVFRACLTTMTFYSCPGIHCTLLVIDFTKLSLGMIRWVLLVQFLKHSLYSVSEDEMSETTISLPNGAFFSIQNCSLEDIHSENHKQLT